jgi:membrane-associated phospholipid phosphatase
VAAIHSPGTLEPSRTGGRARELIDLLTILYVGLVLLGVGVFGKAIPNRTTILLIHAALLFTVCFLVPLARRSSWSVIRFLADWYPIPLYAFMYSAANLSNTLFFTSTFDPFFRDLDRMLFGVEPSFFLARRLGSPFLHEVVHALYFSYYVLIPGVGGVLYARDRSLFQRYLFCVCFAFYVSYLVYIVLPVHGPHGLRGDDFRGGALFVPLMDFIYAHAETAGGAFPSSHVAVAVVCAAFARRQGRALFAASLISLAGIAFSTVYCRYHYAVDSIAGLAWGLLLLRLGELVFDRASSRGEHPG